MKFLFFDSEFASCYEGIIKICEFGYVVTNENFDILEQDNLIINPNISKKQWDKKVVEEILQRSISTYEVCPIFPSFYDKIKKLINDADYVIGHSLSNDARALNSECLRYNKPSIDFDFYDVKSIFKDYSNIKEERSVSNILNDLNIIGDNRNHDAESDAFNTMLELKTMMNSLNLSFEELVQLCSEDIKDRNENFKVASYEAAVEKRINEFKNSINGTGSNEIIKFKENWKRYLQFIDNVKPLKTGSDKLKGKVVSISKNYEKFHYKQTLNLIQLITNEGGKYITKTSRANLFIKYDIVDSDIEEDGRLKEALSCNENGASIDIIDFNDLLVLLEINETELNNLPMVSFDFLYDENVKIKNKEDIKIINQTILKSDKQDNVNGSTLGELFGDVFESIKNEINEKDD